MIVVLYCTGICAQQKQLDGRIINTTDVEGIHILNRTSRINTITDEEGRFEIGARSGDTLFVSSLKYQPMRLVVSPNDWEKGELEILLDELVNELDEVVLGPNLSGNIAADIKQIKVTDTLNFDDVGIPGFKGNPQERIVPTWAALIPTSVNLEAIYKHLSGYYRKLKIKRMWDAQNRSVAAVIQAYGLDFFQDSYQIPSDRVYDYLLFCIETTSLQRDFARENYARVLTIFKERAAIYRERLKE